MSLILLERGSDVLVAEANVWRRIRMHAMADRLERDLAAGVSPDTSVEHSLRAQFLATPKQRTITARALWRSLDDAFDSAPASLTRVAGVASLTRQAVRSNSRELSQIAATLDSPEPVAARGLAQVRLLVTNGAGPLHYSASTRALRVACTQALRSLDARTELGGDIAEG